mmetsp:Transcript_11075/g.33666  ORF Transcript_11075/g.33666 Transcript_11075/m.33666 type:complete len:380 (-) Transcript_11075:64-1203(-)
MEFRWLMPRYVPRGLLAFRSGPGTGAASLLPFSTFSSLASSLVLGRRGLPHSDLTPLFPSDLAPLSDGLSAASVPTALFFSASGFGSPALMPMMVFRRMAVPIFPIASIDVLRDIDVWCGKRNRPPMLTLFSWLSPVMETLRRACGRLLSWAPASCTCKSSAVWWTMSSRVVAPRCVSLMRSSISAMARSMRRLSLERRRAAAIFWRTSPFDADAWDTRLAHRRRMVCLMVSAKAGDSRTASSKTSLVRILSSQSEQALTVLLRRISMSSAISPKKLLFLSTVAVPSRCCTAHWPLETMKSSCPISPLVMTMSPTKKMRVVSSSAILDRKFLLQLAKSGTLLITSACRCSASLPRRSELMPMSSSRKSRSSYCFWLYQR